MNQGMEISELHNAFFEILCILDDICKENDINYFLDSGTELGAVREKDFIAWDDDVDIKIFAEDYPRIKSVLEEKLPSYLHIQEPWDYAPYFLDFTVRIYDDRVLKRAETDNDRAYKNMQNHPGTDIIFLSKASNNVFVQKYMVLKTKILYGMAMAYRYDFSMKKYHGSEWLQVRILSLLGKASSAEKITKKWFDMVMGFGKMRGDYRYRANATLPYLIFCPKWWYEKRGTAVIRNREFPVPAEYDKELTRIYGDYMIPVRKEGQ